MISKKNGLKEAGHLGREIARLHTQANRTADPSIKMQLEAQAAELFNTRKALLFFVRTGRQTQNLNEIIEAKKVSQPIETKENNPQEKAENKPGWFANVWQKVQSIFKSNIK